MWRCSMASLAFWVKFWVLRVCACAADGFGECARVRHTNGRCERQPHAGTLEMAQSPRTAQRTALPMPRRRHRLRRPRKTTCSQLYKCELVCSTQGKVWTDISDKMLKGESWGRGSGRDAGTERGVHGGAARKEGERTCARRHSERGRTRETGAHGGAAHG
ncbi:hypothetical protein BC826DRAFT_161736 [Russula brevipes]|nr:hypothetical protein BC826DRAFT_161736 [Russula brevipes]